MHTHTGSTLDQEELKTRVAGAHLLMDLTGSKKKKKQNRIFSPQIHALRTIFPGSVALQE
jgi:hypothetical protein